MRLLIVPHAPTDWNATGRYQGHSDTSLSELGRRQANRLARRLQFERIDSVYSSDLRRAVETVRTICEPRQLQWCCDHRLRELHFGAWEGLTYAEVQERHAQALKAWEADPLQIAPPGGETLAHLSARIGAFLADVAQPTQLCSDEVTDPDRTALIVAHRGSLRVLLCLALGLPPEIRWRFRIESASLSALNLDPKGGVLLALNDVNHLREFAHAS
jgi:broad specificity phosphatase PhoE